MDEADAEPSDNEVAKQGHVTTSTPRVHVVNINEQTTVRQHVPSARGFRDKPSSAKFTYTIKANHDSPPGNQIGKGLKKADVKETRASFPGRRSAYVETAKCVAPLSSAKSYLYDNPPGGLPEFKLKRRTLSAPVLLAPSGDTKSKAAIRKANTSTSLLTTVNVNDWLADYRAMRSQSWTLKMADGGSGGNGLPKSYPKMMELVKNLRLNNQRRNCQGRAANLDFTVCGNAPGHRDPIDAWAPMSINLYDKYDKYTDSGATSPSGDKLKTPTPVQSLSCAGESDSGDEVFQNGDTSGSVDAAGEGSDVANHVLSLYNEECVKDKPSYSKYYEEGTGQLLKYYIHKEHRESNNNITGRHSRCGAPTQNGYLERKLQSRTRQAQRKLVAPKSSPVQSRTSMREEQASTSNTKSGGSFMGRMLRVGSAMREPGDGTIRGQTLQLRGGFLSIHRPVQLSAREHSGIADRWTPSGGQYAVRVPSSAPHRRGQAPRPHLRPATHAVGFSSGQRSRKRGDSCNSLDLVVKNGNNSPKKETSNSVS